MCVEAINNGYDQYGVDEGRPNSTDSWREDQVHSCKKTINLFLSCLSILGNAQVAPSASFIIGTVPIGQCDQGHVAYHKYLQTNQPPILLCNEIAKKCPFELIRFQRWLANGAR
jgi:hypothetical protein